MPIARLAALLVLFACLALGTAAGEIAAGIATATAIVAGDRRHLPLLAPVAAVAFTLGLSALGNGGAIEVLGRTWPLIPALAVPMLVQDISRQHLARVEQAGLWAAGAMGLAVVVTTIATGVPPWVEPATGPFSHHLTLGYALIVPLARALSVRAWAPAALMVAAVACTGASGPALSVAVVALAVAWRPLPALGLGVGVALAVMLVLAGEPELHQRAVLWATGAGLLSTHPLGVGPDGFRAAANTLQEQLEPGFHYPFHAHDSALHVAAIAGVGAWVAWAWLLATTWARTGRAGKAAIAALVVGSLTQDTLGDLEVVRALFAWALLPALVGRGGVPVGEPVPASDVGPVKVR